MKKLMAIILSAFMGLAPSMSQYAYANPVGPFKQAESTGTSSKPSLTSARVVDLGNEEQALKVLFVNVVEKETPEETLRRVKRKIEDVTVEHKDLRFISITIHPDMEAKADLDRLSQAVHFAFWRDNSNEVVAKNLELSEKSVHSHKQIRSAFFQHEVESFDDIVDYAEEENPNLGDSESFLVALNHTDMNRLHFRRPRTDLKIGLVRGAASALGMAVAVSLGTGGDATATQVAQAAALPGLVALWSGIRNQSITDFEQNSHLGSLISKFNRLKEKNNERARKYLNKMEGFFKNSMLAFVNVLAVQVSMYWADQLQEPVTAATFGAGVALGTARNIGKKSFLIRALHEWTYEKYRLDPKNAAQHARQNAWLMALIGGGVTATDSLQFLANSHNMGTGSWVIDGTMFAVGAALYFGRRPIVNKWRSFKSKCSQLLKRKVVE